VPTDVEFSSPSRQDAMTTAAHGTVLVVEPDRTIARQVQSCLVRAGFTVLRLVDTLREALASSVEPSPDVIVANVTALVEIEAQRQFMDWVSRRGMPIICLSALGDRVTLKRAVDAHAASLIVTPFADRQLVAAVLLATMAAERRTAFPLSHTGLTAEQKLHAIAAIVSDVPVSPGTDGAPGQRTSKASPTSHVPGTPARPEVELLSKREEEVVDLLARGARVVTIARQLHLSPHTVRNHLKSVFRKLNLHGQHELFDFWRAHRQ
jgi:DNA-binding NarL/FixJ family response regulator